MRRNAGGKRGGEAIERRGAGDSLQVDPILSSRILMWTWAPAIVSKEARESWTEKEEKEEKDEAEKEEEVKEEKEEKEGKEEKRKEGRDEREGNMERKIRTGSPGIAG
eukprot:768319-Hanusia_phi.AAC.5